MDRSLTRSVCPSCFFLACMSVWCSLIVRCEVIGNCGLKKYVFYDSDGVHCFSTAQFHGLRNCRRQGSPTPRGMRSSNATRHGSVNKRIVIHLEVFFFSIKSKFRYFKLGFLVFIDENSNFHLTTASCTDLKIHWSLFKLDKKNLGHKYCYLPLIVHRYIYYPNWIDL